MNGKVNGDIRVNKPARYEPPIRHLPIRPIALWLAVFAGALALYVATLAPTVTLVDSGELIVAVRTLGVAHPPGFPLYILLAHIISLLPLGSAALRVNFASALFAALAAATSAAAILEGLHAIGDTRPGRKAGRKRESARVDKTVFQFPEWLNVVAALGAGLLFAASRTLWRYATIAEVYTLNTFLIALVIFLMLRWRRLTFEENLNAGKGSPVTVRRADRWLNAAALVFGLALGVHHVTVALVLPACAVLVLATEGRKFFAGRRLLIAAACAFAGACVYIYLPVAASRSPLMNWGDPRTFTRFVDHVTGWQYRVYFEARPELMGRQIADFFARAAREFGPVWMPLGLATAIAGLGYAYRHARGLFWFVVTAVVANLAYNINYEIAEDKDAYYLPVFMMIAFATAFGLRWLLEIAARRTQGNGIAARLLAAMLLIAVPGIALASNYAFDNRRNYFIARDYVSNICAAVPPGGMLLTLDWQVYSPFLYMREMESWRRDATVIDVNQLRRSWYFQYLERTYPQMMNGVRSEVSAFMEDLHAWEKAPDLFQRNPDLTRRISIRYQSLIMALIRNHSASGPVFVTQDIAAYPPGESESSWTQEIVREYQLIPEGLVFRLAGDQAYHEPRHPPLQTRGLNDGTLRFEDDDVVKIKVLPVYAGMSYNRGRYLANAGRHQQAIEAFQEALAVAPTLSIVRQAMAESQAALRR